MEKEKHTFTEKDGFNIIFEMINIARGNAADSSFYFLLWGWIVVLCTLSELLLKEFTAFSYPHSVWLAVIPGVIISAVHGYKSSEKKGVKTHIDKITMFIWIAFLANYLILIVYMTKLNYQIVPLILMLSASATFLSGITIKEKSLIYGGLLIWISVFFAFHVSPNIQNLISIFAISCGYLLPGYISRNKYKKATTNKKDE
ncbi:MAG: hypothetical protein CSA05_02480 [Bacteroidia bacterium]|nr:MAG: hypothetical protein CSA05_02480 [Bacteroidia bacterium]